MRLSALAAILACSALPAPAQTARLADTGCHMRLYTRDHLARHPEQMVAAIGLRLAGGDPVTRTRLLDVLVRLRGRPDRLTATAYCQATPAGALDCLMEGDAGAFVLTRARDGALRLAVAPRGMSFESDEFITLSGTTGDDRVFLIPPAAESACF